jgi:hypothetical protein
MQGMKRGRLSATFCLTGVLAGAALLACGDDDKTSGRSSGLTLDAGRALEPLRTELTDLRAGVETHLERLRVLSDVSP